MTIERKQEIAIIGMACRFPDANSPEQFWQNLSEGKNSIREIPADRWNWEAYWGNPQKEDNKTNSKWGGFIEDVDKFDPLFFQISPKEANYMDPQQRLFLETVWHAIENAGYAPKQLSGRKIGVYAGVSKNDYAELMDGSMSAFVSTGTVHSILANRVSFFFNFHGPSEAVDTASSSSLVALHNAVRGIQNGECEAAIIGGVNNLLSPRMYISHAKSGMLSADGQCKAFDASANGYVRGEGVGVIMLKPLDKALEDRDQILGVIKATAINHGGKATFLTAPNAPAQADVIYTALKKADVDARNITYIETHGSGTPLGDPIEINGLKQAYGQYFADKNLPPSEPFCGIGSVKTNIGHLESAAGIASIIKVLLSMKHGQLPALRNFNKLNPKISLEQSPFFLVTEHTEWKKREIDGQLQPRQAGISGFGMGGVNAHVILEEPPTNNARRSMSGEPRLVLLSAKEGRIKLHAQQLLDHLRSSEGRQQHLDDIAFTLMFGRAELEERFACIASSTAELAELLEQFLADRQPDSCQFGIAAGNKEQTSVTATSGDDLRTLAASWVKGAIIEWDATSFPGQRVGLPGYPFIKQRCWFEQSTLPTATTDTTNSTSPETNDHSPIRISHQEPLQRDPVVQHVTDDLLLQLVSKDLYKVIAQSMRIPLSDLHAQTSFGDLGVDSISMLSMAHLVNQYFGIDCKPTQLFENETPQQLLDYLWKDKRNEVRASYAKLGAVGPLYRSTGLIDLDKSDAYRGLYQRRFDSDVQNNMSATLIEMARQAGALNRPGMKVAALTYSQGTKQFSSHGAPFTAFIALTKQGDRSDYKIYSFGDRHEPVIHANGTIRYESYGVEERVAETLDLAGIRSRCSVERTHDQDFKPMQEIVFNEEEALATLVLPETNGDTDADTLLHPKALSCVFQTAIFHNRMHSGDDRELIPSAIECVEVLHPIPQTCMVYAQVSENKFNLTVTNEMGLVVAKLSNFELTNKSTASADAFQPARQAAEQTDLVQHAQQYLRELMAPVIGIEPAALKAQEVFEKYGINSVMILELNKILEDEFGGELSKTLFFEYRNLAELTGYFLAEYRDVLARKLNVPLVQSEPVATATASVQPSITAPAPTRSRDIAIIGVAGRYPHANTMEQFWSNLQNGRDSIEEVPSDRFDCQLSTKWGSFIDDVDKFDPTFFNIPPRAAEAIDPQERLFLQTAWHALEDAGYTRESLQDETVGVFVGAFWTPYLELAVLAQQNGHQVAPSTALYSIANRVSYFCNFNGPSFAIDTACSGSLTALHLACQSIQCGESDLALAGGVNLTIGASKYLFLSENNFLSSDGRCRTFGAGGDGYVPGEGVGAVLLKPLDRAIQDGDHIYGVIKGTSINHGGKVNGYTVPNPTAQSELILKALGQSQVNPRTISYMEAHGPGTPLGDPIEITGLTKAYSKYTREKQYCAIGSVKSNIGHLEAAAGIAGLTKVLLQMKHGQIAPSLHSQVLNPNLDFQNTPFFVPQELTEWKRPVEVVDGQVREYPRIAGISSFGAGGSNAHAIIEEYVSAEQPAVTAFNSDSPVAILLSAKNRERLEESVKQLVGAIRSNGWTNADLASIAYTLQVGREAMEVRLALLVGSIGELEQKLEGFLRGDAGLQDVHYGQTKRNDEFSAMFDDDEDMQEMVEKWAEKRKFGKLLGLWVKGLNVNWARAYGDRNPRRMSLPTYPFAKERYWLPDVQATATEPSAARGPIVRAEQPASSVQAVRPQSNYVRPQDSVALVEVAAGAEQQAAAVAELDLGDIVLSGKPQTEYTQLERRIAKIWGDVFGFREINVYDSLFELGADSISMMKLADVMSTDLNADVTLDRLMKYPTLVKLAEFVATEAGEAKQVVYPSAIIDPDNMYEPFSLTDVQMAYLVGRDDTYELGGVSTHIYFEYETELDIARLSQSLQRVIDRHPMLRAVFLSSGEQRILTSVPRYEILTDDVLNEGEEAVNRKIEEVRERLSHEVRNAEQWPLFEFRAVKTSANTHRLFVSVDMLIADGSSYDRIAREMLTYYHNPGEELPKLDITFRDYMMTYEQFKQSEPYLRDRQYWLDQLATFPSAPALPLMASPAEVGVPSFSRYFKSYPKEQWDRVKAMARRHNITPTALLATAYASVLAYWSNQSRLAINLTVFNRFPFHEQINQLVGDFTSIMLLGMDFESVPEFWDRTHHVQDRMMEALSHRHYDGIEFIREMTRYHGLGQQAAMPYVFTSLLQGDGWNSWADIGKQVLGVSQTPQVILDHQAIEVQGELNLNWDYVDTLIDPDVIDKMFKHYTGMIEAWMAEEEASLPGLPESDRAFIAAYNDTSEPIPAQTLHGLFLAQAARTPEREAVRFGNESLTYAELDRRSNQVARYLLERGVGRNDLIGVYGKRHPSTIVSIFGVLKAGAAYVPVDPDYPEDRVQYILSNSNCKVFLEDGAYEKQGIAQYSSAPVDVAHHPQDLAYVIYTSGSTGRPKGVVITHQAAANTVQDMNKRFAVGPEDRILGISSLCFDLSVYDIFGALSSGGALVQIADQRDVRDMVEIVVRERITVWNSVPAVLDLTVDTLEKDFTNTDLRVVLLSGDKIPLNLSDKVKRHFPQTAVISLGGATEASIWSIYYPIQEVQSNWKTIPYGMPLANQTFYVLSPQLELCPINVQGELFIGGVGLAQGYLNDEEKTRAAFFVHPKFGPLYKTGDHGVWRAAGHIEFLGRIDHQVKIRGYRVELGEIETTLIQHPSVKNATVIDRTDAGGKKYICAYIVPEAGADVQTGVLRDHLGETLPDYMVPAHFVAIESIPLTPNGKVDRKALPEPEVSAVGSSDAREPRNATEARLQAICQDVLGVPEVGIMANFFELGLNSVLMVQMINRIGREMNTKITFRDFIRQNNIEELALWIGKDDGAAQAVVTEYPLVEPDPAKIGEEFPLTDIQMSYLVGRSSKFEIGGVSTHFYVEIMTQLDIKGFETALNKMIRRHPMLRSIVMPHGMQKILVDVPYYQVAVEDLRHLSEADRQQRIAEERERMSHYVFQTEQWPLFEFKAIRLTDDESCVFWGYDMLIADSASMGIVGKELMMAYKNPDEELPELKFTFRDYMVAYEDFMSTDTYKRDREFWQNKVENFPFPAALPLKQDPMNIKSPHFGRKKHIFTLEESLELKRKAQMRNITPSALLATAYATVLAYWSNQPDLGLNFTVFNRYPFHADVPAIVGDFTSVIIVDVHLQAGRTLLENAAELQGTLMEALEHRHYDGVQFIRDFSKHHNLGSKAAMPFVFTSMLFGDRSEFEQGWYEMGRWEKEQTQTSQVYVDHQVREVEQKLSVSWDFVEDLFEPRVIETMFQQYKDILFALINGTDEYRFELSEADKAMIEQYNQTGEPIRKATLHELFAEQVNRVPNHPAVKLEDQSLTYRELDLRSNQIARALQAEGVGRGDFVGVLAQRCPETIANMLGILKAGAAYVPVDPEYPEERQTYILQNSACKRLLQPTYYDQQARSQSDAALTGNHHPEDVAYIIYTSGSTGRPKGVVIAHHAAANTILDINNKYSVTENDRILGVSSMCFDLSVYDIFGALSSGATLVMIPDQRHVDNMLRVIEREQITFWNSAPAIMDMLVESLDQQSDEVETHYQWSDESQAQPEPELSELPEREIPSIPTYRWSPKARWESIANGIRIGENEYHGFTKQKFLALYEAAMRGFELSQLESLVPQVPSAKLHQLVQQLIDDRMLISGLPQSEDLFGSLLPYFEGTYNEDLLFSKEALDAYTKQQLDRKYHYHRGAKIGLSQSAPYPAAIEERRSVRDFDRETLIPLQDFADMLSVWKQKRVGGEILYNYSSAGGLYPIDVFVYVKENRIEGLSQGLYYYCPRENALFVVDPNAAITEEAQYFTNKPAASTSAFSIFLIYNADVTMTKYGGRAMMYALIDSGVMVSTLSHAAELQDIGLCSIGDMMFDRIEPYFQLNRHQRHIHTIVGGYKKQRSNKRAIPVAQTQQALTASPLPATATATATSQQASAPTAPRQVLSSGANPFTVNTSLRAVLLSGDWIPLTLPKKVREYFPNADVVSLGGATEASIWSIYYPVSEVQEGWASIPYGRPLANQTFHVLNYGQTPCPVGVIGELYIGGVGLAEGYHNDEEKTVAAFFEHPQLGRLYRTGDYGVLHESGYIEFMGRKDSQVKIRGYRVELNEIASNLLKHPAISNAVVIDRTDTNRKKYLCAYFLLEPGAEVTAAELREALQKDVPEYMVPSYFVQMDAIPLTPNGKVDRKALPEPDLSEGRSQHVEPQTDLERQLADIWKRILEVDRVSTQEDFFDIGGNSLLMVRVKGHLDKAFPDRVSFVDLFTYTTIEQLAAFLEE